MVLRAAPRAPARERILCARGGFLGVGGFEGERALSGWGISDRGVSAANM